MYHFYITFENVVLNASLLTPNYKQIRELITDSNPLPDLDHSPRLSSRHFSIDGDGNAPSMSDKRAVTDFDALLQQAPTDPGNSVSMASKILAFSPEDPTMSSLPPL